MTSAVVTEDGGGFDALVASLAATSSMLISSSRRSVRASLKVGKGCRILRLETMGQNLPLSPRRRVRTKVRSPIGSPKSLRVAAIVSRRRQKSVMEADPCFAVRNSTKSSRAHDSCWPRNSF